MVNVFLLNVSELPDPKECPEVLLGLEEKRIEKTLRYRQIIDRKQSLGAGILLRRCLAERGISVNDIRYNEHGKPEVEGCYFNLSHSHEMVVCAIGDAPVGCDIDKKGRFREGLAERFFTNNEICYLNQFEGERKKDEFLRLWTMKESYAKMTGEGISFLVDKVEFSIEEKVKVYRDGKLCSCNIKEYELPEYRITVCAIENNIKGVEQC